MVLMTYVADMTWLLLWALLAVGVDSAVVCKYLAPV